jgi:Phosphoribosylformylglycinamidine (FGAM) synthase.
LFEQILKYRKVYLWLIFFPYMKLKADVRVGLKQGILDAEGQTIKKSLDLLDFTGISEVKR